MKRTAQYALFLFVFWLPASAAWAQSAAGLLKLRDQTYGGESSEDLRACLPTADGGFLLCGSSDSGAGFEKTDTSRGGFDFWAARTDAAGALLWDKTYGGADNEFLFGAAPASGGGFLLAGYSESPAGLDKTAEARGENDFWIVRIDEDGKILWDKAYGGEADDQLLALAPAADGGFLLAGRSRSGRTGDKSEGFRGDDLNFDFWAVRIDAEGEIVWDKTFGGADWDQPNAAAALPDGGFLLAGYSDSDAGFEKSEANRGRSDFWAVRIDAAGEVVWDKTYGGSVLDRANALAALPDGGFLLAGSSASEAGFEKSEAPRGGASDFWVVRIDEAGNLLWDKTYGGGGEDRAFALAALPGGDFLVGGNSASDAGFEKTEDARGSTLYFDYWVVRANDEGAVVWDKTYGGERSDILNQILPLPDNAYLLAGRSLSGAEFDKTGTARGSDDFWTLVIREGVSAGTDAVICGAPAVFDLNGATRLDDASYRWEPAELVENPGALQTRTLELTETTTFTLTATLPDQTEVSDEITIRVVEDGPAFRQVLKRDANGEANGVVVLGGAKGEPPYAFRLNGAPFSPERFFRGLTADVYLAEIRDANGCEAAREIRIR